MSLALRSFVASHVRDVPLKSAADLELGPRAATIEAPVPKVASLAPRPRPGPLSDEERRELIRRKLQEYVELVNSGSN